jgi:glycosyltransferase involved in cell wall biosynthesis
MLRVLYIVDSLMAGGIESQLVALVTQLDRARIEPQLLCLYGPRARALHFAPALQAAGVAYTTLDLDWSAAEKLRGVGGIIRAVRALRPDLIQAEGYHANLLMRLAAPLLPRRVRLLGTVRGELSAKQLLYERLSQHFCARLIVNAPHLKPMLITRAGIAPGRIEMIPNGIAVDHWAIAHTPHFREQLAPGAQRVLVSIGRISFEKNMHWIAQAMALLKAQGRLAPAVRVFIVGPPHHADAQMLLDTAIREHDLGEVVIQCPETAHPEDYYSACDASLLVSPGEGLPNVALESLSAGRPVIISAAANASGVIEEGVTGWVVRTGDVAALADTLAQVIAMPESALAAMHAACVARAREYSLEHLVSRYTSLYEQIAAHATPS